MKARMTDHARVRMQQRGITEPVLECLLAFGSSAHDHRGGELIYFDHHARTRLRRAQGDDIFKKQEPKLDAYAVLAEDGAVLTVGHRTKRINRH